MCLGLCVLLEVIQKLPWVGSLGAYGPLKGAAGSFEPLGVGGWATKLG
jgi:hypothetical protein